MPTVIYPPAPGTVTGETYSANIFLNQPRLVQRAIVEISTQRFISDFLLQERTEASGGAIMYTVAEGLYADRDPEIIAPGARYPETGVSAGSASITGVSKRGQGATITDESIGRQNFDPVRKALVKVTNTMIKIVDSLVLATVAASVTQTQAATAAWSSAGTARILLDLNLAKSKIRQQEKGYNPDTLIIDDTRAAYLLSDDKLLAGLSREDVSSPTVSASIPVVADLRVLVSSHLPAGVSAMIVDSTMLGGLGYERIPSPGYQGDAATGIQSKVIREDRSDGWFLQTRRPVVPYVTEPDSACLLTGV